MSRFIRSVVQTQQRGCFLQLPAVGECWLCGGLCLLHAPVRQNETLRNDGGPDYRIRWLYRR